MYFELLQGIHSDVDGRLYKVEIERDDKGNEISRSRPVIETDSDLVANFGTRKFRRISEGEARILLEQQGLTMESVEEKPSNDSVTPKSDVVKAVEKGAAELGLENVTESFPKAKKAGMLVFRKADGQYIVLDGVSGTTLSKDGELKSKIQVHSFVKSYVEK